MTSSAQTPEPTDERCARRGCGDHFETHSAHGCLACICPGFVGSDPDGPEPERGSMCGARHPAYERSRCSLSAGHDGEHFSVVNAAVWRSGCPAGAEPTEGQYRVGVDVAYAIVFGEVDDGAGLVARALAAQAAEIVARYEQGLTDLAGAWDDEAHRRNQYGIGWRAAAHDLRAVVRRVREAAPN